MADPQVNPNALGAPAEGFGQTVSFAFDPRGVTPALDLTRSGGVNARDTGTRSAQLVNPNSVPDVQPDGTAALLMKAGAEILAPMIEREKNAQFVSGVQAAMQGEAAADIAKQQPWYSRIFGDTPAVAGARAYEVQNKVNETVSNSLANMDKLQKMGPQEASSHFAGLINAHMTGDPQTDALVSKSMIDQLPGLMKAQAKAYHGYVQKQAVQSMSQNMASAGDALQQAGQLFAEDTINDKDFALRKQAYLHAVMPPDGINEENYAKTLAANLRSAADKGQFHVIAAIKESGGFDALTPEQQNTANAAIDKAAVKARDRYAFDYAREIAEIKSDAAHLPAGMTPNDIAARFTKMNTAYQKLTGSPVALFTSDEVANGLSGTLNFLKAEEVSAEKRNQVLADKTAKANEKLVAADQLQLQVDRSIADGDVYTAKYITHVTQDQIDTSAYKAFTDAKNPAVGAALLRNNFQKGGYVNPILSKEMQGLLRSSEGRDSPTADFFRAVTRYNEFAQGAGGKALADAYFGDYAPRIERFNRMTNGDFGNPNAADAFTAAMSRDKTMEPEAMSHKDAAGLIKAVASRENSSWPRFLGGKVNLRDDALDAVAHIAKANIEDWRGVGGVTDSEAVQRGIAQAVSSGKVQLLGGFAIRRGDAPNGKTLRELASVSPDGKFVAVPAGREDDYFADFLNHKLKDEGAADGFHTLAGASVSIHDAGDAGGTRHYIATVSRDGLPVTHTFTAAEFQTYVGLAVKKDTSKGESSGWWQFGSPITYDDHNEKTHAYYKAMSARAAEQAAQNAKLKTKP